ncbi:MAG: DUF554 domain-containing protein [Clostridia bacterium]|nr:DUF554 domain-containing protein [Clostridia bacterium]
MIGVLVNTAAVIVGSLAGIGLKRFISGNMQKPLLVVMGLISIYIGIRGVLDENAMTMVMILSLVIGTLIGEGLKLDDHLNHASNKLNERFKNIDGAVSVSEGFVTASLLFCVGAMTLVGSLEAGLNGDCTMLYTKSLMDLISSVVLASSLGVGVLLSAVVVFVLQGGVVLLAGLIAPYLTESIILQMTVVGSLLIVALGINLCAGTKIKVLNMTPAIFMPILLCQFMSF